MPQDVSRVNLVRLRIRGRAEGVCFGVKGGFGAEERTLSGVVGVWFDVELTCFVTEHVCFATEQVNSEAESVFLEGI